MSSAAAGNSAKSSGIGVLAEAIGTGGAIALKVSGPAVFSRSGLVTVPTGADAVTKTGVSLTSASLVLAVVQEHAPGFYVQAAVPHVSSHSFTVYLSKAVPAPLKVAWFIVN